MARSEEESAQRVRMLGELTNRTGIEASPLADRMREVARGFTPTGSESDYRVFRGDLLRDGGPIGTVPRPSSFTGAAKQVFAAATGQRPVVLLDKLGERIAFERSGARLYESLLLKYEEGSDLDGGPTREQLMTIHAEELEHFRTLSRLVEELGGDPTAVTPSADVAAVASMGIIQVVTDPRLGFGESLEAILIAELVDHECWKNLRELARDVGHDELTRFAERAENEEDRHLAWVRSWVKARNLAREQQPAGVAS
jgi:rubrerythrin